MACKCDYCELIRSFNKKKYKSQSCGKVGCNKSVVIEGWKGSMHVYACKRHAIEVEDIFGNLPPTTCTNAKRVNQDCGK